MNNKRKPRECLTLTRLLDTLPDQAPAEYEARFLREHVAACPDCAADYQLAQDLAAAWSAPVVQCRLNPPRSVAVPGRRVMTHAPRVLAPLGLVGVVVALWMSGGNHAAVVAPAQRRAEPLEIRWTYIDDDALTGRTVVVGSSLPTGEAPR